MLLLNDIIPLVLAAANGLGVEPNRTQLQKLIYFATDMLGCAPVHRPHYYGPYSPDVSEATLDLVDSDVVIEDCQVSYGPFDANEIRQYSYSLTDLGKDVVLLVKNESPDESGNIRNLVLKLLKNGGKDTKALAIAAKVHYILNRNQRLAPSNSEEIVKHAARLGWEIDENDVAGAIEFLSKTNLLP
ncbi:hypothetical protein EHM69_00590 [candidate division KSB1 bacterium]|nr:MAG: hypothetical protein EHM69_00590 [candidate division KSB1 bacterium]